MCKCSSRSKRLALPPRSHRQRLSMHRRATITPRRHLCLHSLTQTHVQKSLLATRTYQAHYINLLIANMPTVCPVPPAQIGSIIPMHQHRSHGRARNMQHQAMRRPCSRRRNNPLHRNQPPITSISRRSTHTAIQRRATRATETMGRISDIRGARQADGGSRHGR